MCNSKTLETAQMATTKEQLNKLWYIYIILYDTMQLLKKKKWRISLFLWSDLPDILNKIKKKILR